MRDIDPRPSEGKLRIAAILIVLAVTIPFAGVAGAASSVKSPHGKLEEGCGTCHTAEAWTPVAIAPTFDHGRHGFPLTEAHKEVGCRSCHQSLVFSEIKSACVSCHTDVHEGKLGTECQECHSPRSFSDRSEMSRAHQRTTFPLTGAHASLECEACHQAASQAGPQFEGLAGDCVSCHRAAFQSAVDPEHAKRSFPTDCAMCHNTARWDAAQFNHERTAFPLTGSHQQVSCSSCHAGGVYGGTASACVSCHEANYTAATEPDHRAAGFQTDCVACHSTGRWEDGVFEHGRTQIPAVRFPRRDAVLRLPPRGRLQGHARVVRGLPQGRLRRRDGSGAPHGRIPDRVRDVPRPERMEERHLRPRGDGVSAGGRPCPGTLLLLPWDRYLPGDERGVRRLP